MCFVGKLCLSKKYQDSEAARRVWYALGAEHGDTAAVEDLITLDMRLIRARLLEWLTTEYLGPEKRSARYWKAVEMEVMVTIPCMWDEHAVVIMKTACARAGLGSIVKIVYEPLAAAASVWRRLFEGKPNDRCLTFVDIGRGTIDLATVHAQITGDRVLRLKLSVVGKPDGAAIGSQYFNNRSWDYAINCPGNPAIYCGTRRLARA